MKHNEYSLLLHSVSLCFMAEVVSVNWIFKIVRKKTGTSPLFFVLTHLKIPLERHGEGDHETQ